MEASTVPIKSRLGTPQRALSCLYYGHLPKEQDLLAIQLSVHHQINIEISMKSQITATSFKYLNSKWNMR